MGFIKKPKVVTALKVLTLLITGAFLVVPNLNQVANSANSGGPVMVLLSASWCGSCRELDPVVEKVAASSPGVRLITLDVDSGSAPGIANQYGITVSGSDVPQVFLYNHGRTVLLFSGRGYKFGHAKEAETEIRQALQAHL